MAYYDNEIKTELALIESLFEGGKIGNIIELVPSSDYFAHRGCAVIYDAMISIEGRGLPITPETVTPEISLKDEDVLDAWEAGITKCRNHPYDYADHFAEMVAENHTGRKAKSIAFQLNRRAESGEDVGPDAYSEAATALLELRPRGSTMHEMQAATMRTINQIEQRFADNRDGVKIHGISYGIDKLDDATNGMQPGQLIIIGARPSVGKTSLGLSIVNSAAVKNKKKCLFVSLEMTETQDTMRLLSINSEVPFADIEQANLTQGNQGKISRAMQEVSAAPISIETAPGLTIPKLNATVSKMAKEGLDFVVIDYLGLLRHPQFSSGDSNYKEVSEISKSLKEIALANNIPIVCMAQLNRGPASGSAVRAPRMSDLRDSGSIEQDADIVALLHRSEKVKKEYAENDFEPAQLIVDKNRNGRTGDIPLRFNKTTMSFEDWQDFRDFPEEF